MPQPDSPQTIPARTGSRLKKALIPALAVLLGALLALFLIVMFFNPESVLRLFGLSVNMRDGTSGKYNLLRFLGVAMGGVILAIQAANSHRRAKALEETAKAQADAAKRQAEANRNAEKGLRQERLKNAIEHLGHDSPSIRMGGAYELFHLAQDNKELRQTALDILCAHVRRTTGKAKYRRRYASKPSEEIQSLLTLLFVREHEVFKGLHINLLDGWLNGANLREARLRKAVLEGAHLKRAYLSGARLQEAELVWARLQGARLWGAHLQRADLYEAKLQGARLWDAELQGAELHGAHLQGADLMSAHLEGAELWAAHLQGAELWQAQLQKAGLYEAQLQGANLGGARLQGANLRGAHLQGSCLCEAQLQGAILEGAHLQGVVSALIHSLVKVSFEGNIRARAGQESDLSGVVFAGELNREDVDALVQGLSDEGAKGLRERLESHIDKPASHELPAKSGAETGTYTAEQAEEWIAEYEAAMVEFPKEDAG